MNKKGIILSGMVMLGLIGCKATTQPCCNTDPAAAKLAEAADSISHSLVTLAEIQQAQLPPQKLHKLPNPEELNMQEYISVDWSGPVEPFLRKIAQASNYRLRVIGVRPAIPIIITITAHNTPLAYVLRDAAFQSMTKADVVVIPCKRIIELRYAKP